MDANKTELTIYNNNISYAIWYAIISLSNFDIELTIPTVDWLKCPFAVIVDNQTSCLENGFKIFKTNILLRVNQSALLRPVTIQLRSIIYECYEEIGTKHIQFIQNIPKIVYNSKYPCIYNITIPNHMMLVIDIEKLNKINLIYDCNIFVKLSGQFDYYNKPTNKSITKICYKNFDKEYKKILIRNSFALIEIGNLFRELAYLEIDIKSLQSKFS